ncbi:hypothetical protein LZ30DRAFT_755059 [Colletotrichum cereale]|nr:hypothetical protein LZ30DRAFT_755059 [Colletotrichum cereale]
MLARAARRGARKPSLSQARTLASFTEYDRAKMASTMPPGHKATVAQLETFTLPDCVTGSKGDLAMGKALVDAWRRDGILQVSMNEKQQAIFRKATVASKKFFAKPPEEKAACVNSQSYSGYIASGEEITDGIADYSEIFTVTKDLDLAEPRVRANGAKLLQLVELGLNVPAGSLTNMTDDGWHYMRILRFPPTYDTNGKGKEGRGIGSYTDYGLLHYVPPVLNVFTVFPGDIMQYITNSYLPSTPYKAVAKPLPGYSVRQSLEEGIHYSTHFINMFVRNYPERITTKRIHAENRLALLQKDELCTISYEGLSMDIVVLSAGRLS